MLTYVLKARYSLGTAVGRHYPKLERNSDDVLFPEASPGSAIIVCTEHTDCSWHGQLPARCHFLPGRRKVLRSLKHYLGVTHTVA